MAKCENHDPISSQLRVEVTRQKKCKYIATRRRISMSLRYARGQNSRLLGTRGNMGNANGGNGGILQIVTTSRITG
jgi:hypothetical protein